MTLDPRPTLDLPLQTTLPFDAFAAPRLPGVAPLDPQDWLHVDEAYAAQMALRAHLLKTRRPEVFWQDADADTKAAASELLDTVLAHLPEGFVRTDERIRTPDGRDLRIDRDQPMLTCAALVQEDLCLMLKSGDQHVLKAAILCFPASWMLSEKAGRPLTAIHAPVADYDDDLARRVQRLFDGVRPGRPLWRFNALWYQSPDLFQPRSALARRTPVDAASAPYFRSERQVILRLPRSGAVVFSIHTYVLRRADALAAQNKAPRQTGI